MIKFPKNIVQKTVVNSVISIIIGFIAVIIGLLISFHYGTAGGATMALVSVLEFFVVMIIQSGFRAFRKDRSKVEKEISHPPQHC